MALPGGQPDTDAELAKQAVARAFGSDNRARLLTRYFLGQTDITLRTAWQHVYRLLLWIDRTTALAHCYESDKAQPGRPWYGRSLAFHDWICTAFGVAPDELGQHIDWLFREAIKDLASRSLISRTAAYEEQRAPYQGRSFPEPGEDPELIDIVKDALGSWMTDQTPDEALKNLTRRLYAYMTQENKRKNLVGEGFEDVIGAVMSRLPFGSEIQIRSRALLHDLPGFHSPPANEKAKKVDLALITPRRRVLMSAKWSVRADREEQFQSDFEAYARLESAGQDFDYVLVTNEFDAARLKAACERRKQNAALFSSVVHINPEGVLAAYGNANRGSVRDLRGHVADGRLISLEQWLMRLQDDIAAMKPKH